MEQKRIPQVKIIKQENISPEAEQKFEDDLNKFLKDNRGNIIGYGYTSDMHGAQKCNLTYNKEVSEETKTEPEKVLKDLTYFEPSNSTTSDAICKNCNQPKSKHGITNLCPID